MHLCLTCVLFVLTHSHLLALMSSTDSKAVFFNRCKAVGLDDAEIRVMEGAGFTTYANFAFSSSFQPGAVDETPFEQGVLVKVLGDKDHAKAPALRRLFYESYTLVAAELKKRVDRTEDDKPKVMPLQERASRWSTLKARLVGMTFTEETEPSFALIDLFAQQVDDGQIRYIEWSACAKRSQEVDCAKRANDLKVWSPDANGVVRQSTAVTATTISLSSDLKWRMALTRRGLAAEMAKWCRFETHERIVDLLQQAWLEPPLPGFMSISFEQLARVDRAIFKRLAEECRTGIDLDVTTGDTEIDYKLGAILVEPNIRCLLLPLQGHSSKRSVDTNSESSTTKFQKGDGKRDFKGDGKGRGRGRKGDPKGKGRGQKRTKWKSRDASGAMVCFPYNNVSGCSRDGCTMKHICAKCFADHPAHTCNK